MINLSLELLKPIYPEIFTTISTLIILMLGVIRKNPAKLVNICCILVLIFGTFLLHCQNLGFENIVYRSFYIEDKFTLITKIILFISTILILIMYHSQIEIRKFSFEFPVLIVFAVIGMMVMISANDFLSMYLGFEIQSLCLYVLAAFDRDKSDSSEAGIKYFVLGAIASGMLLFGISLIYGFSGTTNFSLLKVELFNSNSTIPLGLLIGLIMIIISLCFKISAAPFHIWTPDVYQGAPLIVTSFFSVVPKAASTLLLVRLVMDIFADDWIFKWQQIIIFVSALSMIVGSAGALKQTSVKRILAYSSIGHIGYILIGLAAGSRVGIEAIFLYIALYIIMNIGIFAFLLMLNKENDLEMKEFNGLSKNHPIYAFGVSILLLSMAGIPPMAGFFTKFYIFKAAIDRNLYFLVIIGVVSSVIATYYYLRIIKIMYFEDVSTPVNNLVVNKGNFIIFTLASIINILFFCFGNYIPNNTF